MCLVQLRSCPPTGPFPACVGLTSPCHKVVALRTLPRRHLPTINILERSVQSIKRAAIYRCLTLLCPSCFTPSGTHWLGRIPERGASSLSVLELLAVRAMRVSRLISHTGQLLMLCSH